MPTWTWCGRTEVPASAGLRQIILCAEIPSPAAIERRGPLADEDLTGVLVALVLAIVLITMLGERIV